MTVVKTSTWLCDTESNKYEICHLWLSRMHYGTQDLTAVVWSLGKYVQAVAD